jgi:hypothetical protein
LLSSLPATILNEKGDVTARRIGSASCLVILRYAQRPKDLLD